MHFAFRTPTLTPHASRRGVLEYLVVCLAERELRWYDLAARRELSPDSSGIFRIRTFPGLWIDGAAVVASDYERAMASLAQGLASPEHRDFVGRLAHQVPPSRSTQRVPNPLDNTRAVP